MYNNIQFMSQFYLPLSVSSDVSMLLDLSGFGSAAESKKVIELTYLYSEVLNEISNIVPIKEKFYTKHLSSYFLHF